MRIKTLMALAAIVVVSAAIAATQPSEFRVARTASIAASASVVFAQVNDFHNWRAWSPLRQTRSSDEENPRGCAGRKNFLSKAVGLFMDMDKLAGGQFDGGLAQLKPVAEAALKQ
jgi:hypothetical protein